jgi:cytochrome bd-type quinol oxidase subunit 2
MNQVIVGGLFAAVLFGGMLAFLEAGWRWGKRRLAQDPDGAREGVGSVEGAVFGLLGLLIAFTFSGAATRFDGRRALIVEEANDIGTAWLRLDLLPEGPRAELREQFRRYLDCRLEAYRRMPDQKAAFAALAESQAIQGEIWRRAVAAMKESGSPSAPMLLLPALNAMFDIASTRAAATKTHPPTMIFVMLAVVSLTSALLAGHGMAGGKRRSFVHRFGFAAIIAGAVFVIFDLEFPRLGFVRVTDFDQILVELRRSMD